MGLSDGEAWEKEHGRVDTTVIPPKDGLKAAMKATDEAFENIPEEVLLDVATGRSSSKDPTMPKAAKLQESQRRVGLKNAGEGVNPKDRVGASKVDMTLIPSTAKVHCALALMDGATKYGPYNWRVEPIQARTYIAAIMRHCEAYLDGEMSAPDSGILHMGHIMANAAILLDAEMQGMLVDDRPITIQSNSTASIQLQAAHDWINKHKQPGWGR